MIKIAFGVALGLCLFVFGIWAVGTGALEYQANQRAYRIALCSDYYMGKSSVYPGEPCVALGKDYKR